MSSPAAGQLDDRLVAAFGREAVPTAEDEKRVRSPPPFLRSPQLAGSAGAAVNDSSQNDMTTSWSPTAGLSLGDPATTSVTLTVMSRYLILDVPAGGQLRPSFEFHCGVPTSTTSARTTASLTVDKVLIRFEGRLGSPSPGA